jgi:hypothetical protein
MVLLNPPTVRRIDRMSPTLYEAAMKCIARAAWLVAGDRKLLPPHPRALLGISVHAVLERAREGGIKGVTDEQSRLAAERFFDERTKELYDAAHPLLRAKFDSPERLPFYYLFRSRAARMAAEIAVEPRTPQVMSGRSLAVRVSAEAMLISKDGRLTGRPDVIDAKSGLVIDYKTGSGDSESVSDVELRQLKLYALLATDNDIAITHGVIERADRTRIQVPISAAEASEEGRHALNTLAKYNSFAGEYFESAAAPSKEACRHCPCIPFCEAFWRTSTTDWSAEVGTHLEGVVQSIEGDALVSLHLEISRGTAARGQGVVTRLSREWLALPGVPIPQAEQVVRVIDAKYLEDSDAPAVFRADRVSTTVWTLGSEVNEGDSCG